MIVLFKLFLVVAVLLILRVYLVQVRSVLRDRLVVLLLFGGLAAAVVYPEATTWVAKRLGIGRGVDLAFYTAFLLLFFLVGVLNARRRESERAIAALVEQLALLRARPAPDDQSSLRTIDQ